MGIKEDYQRLSVVQRATQEAAEKFRKDRLVKAKEERETDRARTVDLITPHLEDLRASDIVTKIKELCSLRHPLVIKRILQSLPYNDKEFLVIDSPSNIDTLRQELNNPLRWLPAYVENFKWDYDPVYHPEIISIQAVGYRVIFARPGETDVIGDIGGDWGGGISSDLESRFDVLVGRKTTGKLEFIIDHNICEPFGVHPHRITIGPERVDSYIAQVFLNNFHRTEFDINTLI